MSKATLKEQSSIVNPLQDQSETCGALVYRLTW